MSGAVLKLFTLLQRSASWAHTSGQLHSTTGGGIAAPGRLLDQLQVQVGPHSLASPWHSRAILAWLPPVSALPHKAHDNTFEPLLQARLKDIAALFERRLLLVALCPSTLAWHMLVSFSMKHATAKASKRPTQASRVLLHCVRRAIEDGCTNTSQC